MSGNNQARNFGVQMPSWIEANLSDSFQTLEARMSLAIDLAQKNVANKTGGPFGAAVFDLDSGELISMGVNLVVNSGYSFAHAEIVALTLAQENLHQHDLSKSIRPNLQLVTSVEPCSMCLGAIPWSGVRSVVCGARTSDAEEVGFDEGPKSERWTQELESRGIEVIRDINREAAVTPLQSYQRSGGEIYNGRSAD